MQLKGCQFQIMVISFQIIILNIFINVVAKSRDVTKLEQIIRLCFSRSAAAKNVITFEI